MSALAPDESELRSSKGPVRLAKVLANGGAGQWDLEKDIDWSRGPRPPVWISKDQLRSLVSQIYHGERTTTRVCQGLRPAFGPGLARDCLDLQIRDEQRHAQVYQRYLQPLGGVAPMNPHLAAALEAAGRGPAGPISTMVAFHVVIEGEFLRVQGPIGRLTTCPLLRQINRLVARDEARHAAFGRIFLTEVLAELCPQTKQQIYDWVHDLWRQATLPTLTRRLNNPIAQKVMTQWLKHGWRHHQARLCQIGLVGGRVRAPLRASGP